jgi:hypothetical protein
LFVFSVHGNVDIPLTTGITQIIPPQKKRGKDEQILLITKVQHIMWQSLSAKNLIYSIESMERIKYA